MTHTCTVCSSTNTSVNRYVAHKIIDDPKDQRKVKAVVRNVIMSLHCHNCGHSEQIGKAEANINTIGDSAVVGDKITGSRLHD